MSFFYMDASAWVKRYLKEPGSDRVTELFFGRERLVGTALGYVEVARGDERYKLRGADAIHLSAALEFHDAFTAIGEKVTLVASDQETLGSCGGCRASS